MRPIDGDALKESLKESRDNCSLWLQDCKEARSQKWIGRAEQALMTFNECIMRIDTIPTIEPGIKTGKWIVWGGMDVSENHGRHKCSECGEFALLRYEKPLRKEILSDFCPNCGAKMGVQE